MTASHNPGGPNEVGYAHFSNFCLIVVGVTDFIVVVVCIIIIIIIIYIYIYSLFLWFLVFLYWSLLATNFTSELFQMKEME